MSILLCKQCGEILTAGNQVMKSVSKKGKQYYLNRCKTCLHESDVVLRDLKKKHPKPAAGTACACCHRIDVLLCDHDHASKDFRGWICKNCNSGLGLLGDSEQGLRLALAYLERSRSDSNSRSPRHKKNDDTVKTESVELASRRSDNWQQGTEDVPANKRPQAS